MNGPIFNAKSKNLNQQVGTLPNMANTLLDWFQPLQFSRIVKTIVNFELKETLTTVDFMGVIEPISAQELAMKPEGERRWIWNTIWSLTNLDLKPDEIITINCVNFRVMKKHDWSSYGYYQFEIMQDYKE